MLGKKSRSRTLVNAPYQPTPFVGRYFALLTVGGILAIVLYVALALGQGLSPFSATFDVGPSTARIELLKLALASTAGIAAIAGLYVAYRKQRNDEANSVREQDRVFTERFTAAAELLQSAKAAVRLAGLNSLARLADDSPRDRPTCLETICSYLRLPMATPEIPSLDTASEDDLSSLYLLGERKAWPDVEEWEVRRSALRLVTDRLRPSRPEIFWSDANVDLRDSILIEFDLSSCKIDGAIDASGSLLSSSRGLVWEDLHIDGDLVLNDARVICYMNIHASSLDGQNFLFSAQLYEPFDVTDTRFMQHISLSKVQARKVSFQNVIFGESTIFSNLTVRDDFELIDCDLAASRPLQGPLSGEAEESATFLDLQRASIGDGLTVRGGSMPDIVRLVDATVEGNIELPPLAADLRGARLEGDGTGGSISFLPPSALLNSDTVAPTELLTTLADRPFQFTTPATRSDGYWRI